MKKLFALLVGFTVISCTNAQKTEFSTEALNETLLAQDGAQVAFKDIIKQAAGKTTVIEVWASWCGDCVKAMPKTKELQASNPEVSFVFISMDKKAEKWQNGILKHDLKGTHYMANDQMKGVFGKAIDLSWIPRYMIIDKTGKVALYNAKETDFDKINATLAQLK